MVRTLEKNLSGGVNTAVVRRRSRAGTANLSRSRATSRDQTESQQRSRQSAVVKRYSGWPAIGLSSGSDLVRETFNKERGQPRIASVRVTMLDSTGFLALPDLPLALCQLDGCGLVTNTKGNGSALANLVGLPQLRAVRFKKTRLTESGLVKIKSHDLIHFDHGSVQQQGLIELP